MKKQLKHQLYCFAGQPASCLGYFPDDVLPCVCGAQQNAAIALSQVAFPSPLGGSVAGVSLAPETPRPINGQAAQLSVLIKPSV